jgi:hypothetical protein
MRKRLRDGKGYGSFGAAFDAALVGLVSVVWLHGRIKETEL